MAITKVTTPVTDFDKSTSLPGLKLPSGDNSNQPTGAAAEQGMIRNDTEETVNSSASALAHYNGTNWQYFAATESPDNPLPASLKMYLNSTDTASYSGSGTAWNDLTSNSNNATLANITQPSSTFLTWNGSSSYAVLPSDPDIGAGTNWSVSMWVYERTSQVTNYNMIDYAHSLNGGWTIQGGVYYVKNSAGQYSSMSVNITSNTWNHLVISSNGSTATNIYINNVATAASPTSMPNVTWNVGYDFTAGAWNNQAGSYARNWNGDMTKIQIYNTNLSVAEVNTLFLEGKGF
jgi:hypothetical protein